MAKYLFSVINNRRLNFYYLENTFIPLYENVFLINKVLYVL